MERWFNEIPVVLPGREAASGGRGGVRPEPAPVLCWDGNQCRRGAGRRAAGTGVGAVPSLRRAARGRGGNSAAAGAARSRGGRSAVLRRRT